MSTNIALGRPTAASSYVMPFSASRAVDNNLGPTYRWLSGTVPCWMSVNLGAPIYINRWVVKHMGAAGWQSPSYVMSNYKLQGSLDGTNWFDIDIVSGNALNTTDRTFTAVQVVFVRVYVTSGLNINPKMASIVELQIYDAPPTSQYLSGLTLSTGTLTPTFSTNTYSYTSSVANSVDKIKVTPTAVDPQATIKVNGMIVASGTASVDIPLNVGANTITVQVTSKIGGLVQNYTVNVTRAASALLTNLVPSVGTMNPTFTSNTTSYTVNVDNNVANITLTPTAQDASATITVNGTTVASGNASQPLSLNVGDNNIPVVVTASGGVVMTYNVKVVRASSVYLTGLAVTFTALVPTFNKNIYNYTANYSGTSPWVKVKPTSEDSTATIYVNDLQVSSGVYSQEIGINSGTNIINIKVVSAIGQSEQIYQIVITKS